jgi:hypothetical protein
MLACSTETQKQMTELRRDLRSMLVNSSHVSAVDVDFIAVVLGPQGLGKHEFAHPV